jgi:hypothetical protein
MSIKNVKTVYVKLYYSPCNQFLFNQLNTKSEWKHWLKLLFMYAFLEDKEDTS